MYTAYESEWIITNRVGGYALSYFNMINKRKYNGLLIASTSLLGRVHILSSIEEKVEFEDISFFLDSNHYSNCIYPNGHEHVVRAWLRPNPAVLYSTNPPNDRYLIMKEVFLAQGLNAAIVKYTNMSKCPISLALRPKFTLRDQHFLNQPGTFDYTAIEKESIESGGLKIRRADNGVEAFIYVEKGRLVETNVIYRAVYYPVEAMRGYEAVEDLISPARIDVLLSPGESAVLVFSSEPLQNFMEVADAAQRFYRSYPTPKTRLFVDKDPALLFGLGPQIEFDKEEYLKLIELMANEFVLDSQDIIAGYPWFGAWGRDTVISLPSLRLLEGGEEIGRNILLRYGEYLKDGLLPNTFGEGGVGLNYDSVDAPLWYILAAGVLAPRDPRIFEYASSIILNYYKNIDLPFYTDLDGLISIHKGPHALTWMDAKVHGIPVTPRHGKPVEIESLWFNALSIVRDMAKLMGVSELKSGAYKMSVDELEELISLVKDSFQKFVGDTYLADRLDEEGPVWEVRPNAVIALSLPYDIVSHDVMKMVWNTARNELLTPCGLRSLSPHHPAFKRKYLGNQRQRDLAYHQGTVWTYLLLPYVKLTVKVFGGESDKTPMMKEIAKCVWTIRHMIMRGELASVPELWDATEPYIPKGAPAQAWSAFALLEIEDMLRGVDL